MTYGKHVDLSQNKGKKQEIKAKLCTYTAKNVVPLQRQKKTNRITQKMKSSNQRKKKRLFNLKKERVTL